MLKAPVHLPPSSPTMNPVEFVASAATSLLSGANSPTSIVILSDPELQLGHDLRIAEHPVFFADGDSMQGSHYCAMTGTYIMQWKIRDVLSHVIRNHYSNSTSAGRLNDSAGTSGISNHEVTNSGIHKCKLMYYHELLNSDDFKGSVASLESCRSSFSSLAAAANSTLNSNSHINTNARETINKFLNV